MTEEKRRKWDWMEKLLTSAITGLLIALTGFIGNIVLSNQESARLITELQIKREQAESELRKDVFDQALEAFLLKGQGYAGTLDDMSKQLLRLELLALNFGDSLSLSPLFIEFRSDLQRSKPVNNEKVHGYEERRGELRKRLIALAKRVASAQLSSIAQHGDTKEIYIPLYEYNQLIEKEDEPCKKMLFDDRDFAWPGFDILTQLGAFDSEYRPVDDYKAIDEIRRSAEFKELTNEQSLIELNGVKRYLQLNITDVNHCEKTARVQIILVKDGEDDPEVNRIFTLDYFNFPMVDNTRLSENQRFAIIMEAFDLKSIPPRIEITGVVFPSEYASLRDRPGMQEARKLLESALHNEDDSWF